MKRIMSLLLCAMLFCAGSVQATQISLLPSIDGSARSTDGFGTLAALDTTIVFLPVAAYNGTEWRSVLQATGGDSKGNS